MTNWDVAASALDHRDTVEALGAALPELTSPGGGLALSADDVAHTLAANLAKVGLALVPLSGGPLADQPVGAHLKEEAATSWFGREGD